MVLCVHYITLVAILSILHDDFQFIVMAPLVNELVLWLNFEYNAMCMCTVCTCSYVAFSVHGYLTLTLRGIFTFV